MSKGSKQRPKQIIPEEMQRRWELAFNDMKDKKLKPKDKKYHMNIEIK